MKIKYTGDQDSVTIRGVTFQKGKATTIDCPNLAAKMLAWPDCEEVKRGRKKNDQDAA